MNILYIIVTRNCDVKSIIYSTKYVKYYFQTDCIEIALKEFLISMHLKMQEVALVYIKWLIRTEISSKEPNHVFFIMYINFRQWIVLKFFRFNDIDTNETKEYNKLHTDHLPTAYIKVYFCNVI